MSQKLILPINACKVTASMGTSAYKAKYGFSHYGVDMVSTKGTFLIYASGTGKVVATGRDAVVGNVVIVQYNDALNRKTSRAQNLVFRYFHLTQISVKPGQPVDKNTVLGIYGSTGSLPMSPHLHLEADSDIKYPLFTPTVSRSDFLKGTTAGANSQSICNPLDYLYCKTTAPDNQTYITAADAFVTTADRATTAIS